MGSGAFREEENIGTLDRSPSYLLLCLNPQAHRRCVRCSLAPTTASELSAGLPVATSWNFILALLAVTVGIQIMLKFLYMKPDPFCRFIIEPRRGKNWSLDPSLVARNGIGPWVLEPSEKREISARSIRVLATCSSVQTRRPTISVCATRWRPQLLVSCLRASQSPPRGPSSSRCLLSPSSVGTTAPARPV
jgi:hypothetical protein